MSLFAIEGTVTAVGQSLFDNDVTIYAYIEITETSGRRVMVEKVGVCNDVATVFRAGMSGEFFVDRLQSSRLFRCQLWGIKSEGREIFDSTDAREKIAIAQLIYGLLLTPLFGLGLLVAIPALFRLLQCITGARRRMFYGTANVMTAAPRQQVMRI